jgi:hypothetical protein
MTNTLHEHLRATFTSAAVSELARLLGDTNLATQKAIDGLLPTIISGVVHRAQTEEGATTLYRLLTTTSFDTDPSLAQLAQTDSHRQKAAESGNRLLGELFPDRVERLAQSTAQYSGVSQGTATTLTGLVMSVLMGYLHGQTKSRNLTGPSVGHATGERSHDGERSHSCRLCRSGRLVYWWWPGSCGNPHQPGNYNHDPGYDRYAYPPG